MHRLGFADQSGLIDGLMNKFSKWSEKTVSKAASIQGPGADKEET